MTVSASISDFRDQLSSYIYRLNRGVEIILRDEKKKIDIARITPIKRWDPIAYKKMLRGLIKNPVFTAENHPEWATLKDVQEWLRKTRKNADRDFSYIK